MRKFALKEAKNWFKGPALARLRRDRRIQSVLKNKKITILTILIFISGCFFYNRLSTLFPYCFANDYESEGYLEHEREWVSKINYVESMVAVQKEEQKKNHSIEKNRKEEPKIVKEEINKIIDAQNQIYDLVGNAPIKEMVPSILKLDQRVAAFIIGIAKKESDWGRHAPSLAGKTCYNFWGYKGSGSRGTSMGYACFGSPEEAVEIVGKRIGTLVAKNINEPRKMLVWKCGSSCAGHDPGGVKKWVSDVSLYFGKVMQIKNI